jgi:hypothetical protein
LGNQCLKLLSWQPIKVGHININILKIEIQ